MNKLVAVSAVALSVGLVAGCATTRDAYQKEFERLSSLQPAAPVASPNRDVANCAQMSCDLFNEAHSLMKAYVAKTEANLEYTGFMNDVQYYVDEEKMDAKAACKKVADDVIAADAQRPDDQKLWPKIQKGIAAANSLDPKKQLAQIAILVARNTEIVKSVSNLPNSFQNEDFMGKAQRGVECANISKQLSETLECLTFLGDQYSRVLELEAYAR
jgi:hypothetical protein